ncbi:MAG: hypothetical protein JKY19_14040 [Alcanivoracaceae bacterium]|nr:hypothetical protein [Alcanivoracaceae bacterium]
MKNQSNVYPILANSSDKIIEVSLNKLLVRNSSGSWAKDAKWDEYIFHIENISDKSITIENITIIGALDKTFIPLTTRRHLNKETRSTINRYKKAGIKIKLGDGSTNMLAGSLTGAVVGTGIGAGIASTGALTTSAGTLTTAGGAVVVAIPALAIGGIVKIVNNTKVSNQIKKRQTQMPLSISTKQKEIIDLFYSAIPGPKQIEILYSDSNEQHVLIMNLGEKFNKLHYKQKGN